MKTEEFLSEREIQLEILKELREIKQNQRDRLAQLTTDIGIIDNSDLIRTMKISAKTAARWRKSGLLRFTRLGGKFYYYLPDIKAMIQEQFSRN